jgi:hypothetical protein
MNATTVTRSLLARVAVVFIFALFSTAALGETFYPPDPDLGDLDHTKAYIWNIDVTWDVLQDVVDAMTLKIDNIRNFDNNDNDLWIHLLDGNLADPELVILTDNQDGIDYFDGQGILLEHYEDLPSWSQDLYHYFTPAELDKVTEYAADGRFALAFDPDCHFYNCYVTLTAYTTAIPEPGAVGLAVLCLSALGIVRLRKGRK